jgi:peptidoglycan/LPS O-acetylase OafA/YrhL
MGRLAHVDGLRGIAASLVVFMHACGMVPGASDFYAWLLVIDPGRVGVVAFFCISGFLIPFTVDDLRTFVVRRASRILPAFWLSIPLSLLVASHAFGLKTIVLNILMVPRLFGNESISGVYWTLEIEVLFYVLCAFLFVLGVLRNATVLLTLSCGGGILFFVLPLFLTSLEPNHSGFLRTVALYLTLMMLAAVFRLWMEDALARWQSIALLAFTVLGALIVLSAVFVGSQRQMTLLGCTMAGVLLFLSTFVAKGWFEKARPLGVISYSLYLLHPIAFTVIPWSNPVVFVLAAMSLSIFLATATYYAVERPGIQAGHTATLRSAI